MVDMYEDEDSTSIILEHRHSKFDATLTKQQLARHCRQLSVGLATQIVCTLHLVVKADLQRSDIIEGGFIR